MSERKIADTRGKFTQVVQDGTRLNDAAWTTGRIILSNERLILVGNDGKRTIALSEIRDIGGRYDVNTRIAEVPDYISLTAGTHVVLVAPRADSVEIDLYRAMLDRQMVLVKHPAVEGGVVQDTDWEKAQLQVESDALNVATASGTFVSVALDDISGVEVSERTVVDEKGTVVEADHSVDETSVQTYFAGPERACTFVESLLRKGEQHSATGVDLDEVQREVLMALYSGVSPFELADFLGMDVDDVEAVFDRLVELELVEVVRTRREVALNARGRNVASNAMNEQ